MAFSDSTSPENTVFCREEEEARARPNIYGIFQGRVTPLAAPINKFPGVADCINRLRKLPRYLWQFSGAADGINRPRNGSHFQGWLMPLEIQSLGGSFSGADDANTRL